MFRCRAASCAVRCCVCCPTSAELRRLRAVVSLCLKRLELRDYFPVMVLQLTLAYRLGFLLRLPHTRVSTGAPHEAEKKAAIAQWPCASPLPQTLSASSPLWYVSSLSFLLYGAVCKSADSIQSAYSTRSACPQPCRMKMATPSLPPSSAASPSYRYPLDALNQLVAHGLHKDDIVTLKQLGPAGVGRLLAMLELEGRSAVVALLESLENTPEEHVGAYIDSRNALMSKSSFLLQAEHLRLWPASTSRRWFCRETRFGNEGAGS